MTMSYPGAHDRIFLDFIAADELRLPFDPATGQALGLHRRRAAAEWRPAAGTGTVLSFTVTRRQYAAAFPVPLVHGLIALDEGPTLIARILGAAPAEVSAGMPVRAGFDSHGLWFGPCQARVAEEPSHAAA